MQNPFLFGTNMNIYNQPPNINFYPIQNTSLINKVEIIRCLNCNMIPDFKIFPNTNTILTFCHNHRNISNYSIFLSKCLTKCPYCFQIENKEISNNSNACPNCHKVKEIKDIINNNINKCIIHQQLFYYYCSKCNLHLCAQCILHHACINFPICNLSDLFLSQNDEKFIENNLKKKEDILNYLIKYIENIPNDNKYKGKGNQLLILLYEKRKEIDIEKLFYMNYKEYKNNCKIIMNGRNLLNFEKNNFLNLFPIKITDNNFGKNINYIRSYIQNNYQQVHMINNMYSIENFKNNCSKNIYHIHNKNIKSICALNESLIISGSWDNNLKIFNIYINQEIYSIPMPSMIFNLKKYPLITNKGNNDINFHGILVCLYCELLILKIVEKNSIILGHSNITSIRGFGNFIWTSIILEPDKKIISACLDKRLSAHILLPNDRNINDDIKYCLIKSDMNNENENETITSLLQIDEKSFVSSSSMDLTDNPSIKFWSFNNSNEFKLEKAIYDIYCCQYPNSICKINNNILGFALEYASLRGKMGGIALVDIKYKEIILLVKMFNISCILSKYNNHFFACGFDRNYKKRYLKEFVLNNELVEINSLELKENNDDIINIEIIDESDLMAICSDDGKLTIFDNYSKCVQN